ncbi:MAG: hypothetical protein KGJ59_09255 [Bacteroidota bacterium]|nr:hypothetical protein [Bacteroidota bacterium]
MLKCKTKLQAIIIAAIVLFSQLSVGQPSYTAPPMPVDVNSIHWTLSKTRGDGGMVNEYSWNFATFGPDFDFFWPADHYLSNMLYQIFSPICLSDSGLVDTAGIRHPNFADNPAISQAATDWTWERRRYRPPDIYVDGIKLNPTYYGGIDPALKADEICEFNDLIPAYGMRAHVKIYAFSNPELSNVAIWQVTLAFTGEIALPKYRPPKRIPDQTITMWWPFSMSFGPTMLGKLEVYNSRYTAEVEDVLDSWIKTHSQHVTDDPRDSLYVAYYWDYWNNGLAGSPTYPNGSQDNSGDPDRTNGHLYSPQVPGYALLYAPVSASNTTDDPNEPFSMPHASITLDLWQRRDLGLRDTYIGTDNRGKFPLDPITAGLATSPQKGPMRFITTGPYSLTKNDATGRYDSVTFVYAIATGSVPYEVADSVGRAWFTKEISDAEKDSIILTGGRDSLLNSIDRAYWAWDQLSHGKTIPAPPPPPDVNVRSAPDSITVNWSYPEPSYFKNAVTGVDDWYAWRVYRKTGAYYVDDPNDQGTGATWQLMYETRDRNQTTFRDTNVTRGVNYYYAVTAMNDGTQNNGLYLGMKLESSRYATRTSVAASPFKPGLSVSGKVRVVPNPATSASGALGRPAKTGGGPTDQIAFYNLPLTCTLSIYTETGNLIKRWKHYGPADDYWDQRTSSNQYVASGIYILAVTDSQGLKGENLSDYFVKFVIVR